MSSHFAIDMDGTLLEYSGWMGEEHFGAPLPGAIDRVKEMLRAGHTVTIFTSRAKDGPSSTKVHDKLVELGFPPLPVTNVKSQAFSLIIDDRALRQDGADFWERMTVEKLAALKSWTEEEAAPTANVRDARFIKKVGSEYCVISHKTGKSLGCHPSRKEAFAQLAAIKSGTGRSTGYSKRILEAFLRRNSA